MSTIKSVGRFTATHKKDRANLCAFAFADGAAPAIRISVTSTPKKKPKPSPPNRPVRTYLPSFQQICFPLVI